MASIVDIAPRRSHLAVFDPNLIPAVKKLKKIPEQMFASMASPMLIGHTAAEQQVDPITP